MAKQYTSIRIHANPMKNKKKQKLRHTRQRPKSLYLLSGGGNVARDFTVREERGSGRWMCGGGGRAGRGILGLVGVE